MKEPPILSVRDLSVRYGATIALDRVDVDVRPGEVHAVVGENGAGKSTLLRAIAGAVRPSAGSIHRRAQLRPAWVPQEPDLPNDLTAAAWIFLGCERRHRCGWLRREAMDREAGTVLRDLGCPVAPGTHLGALSPPQRKQVQLARAMRMNPDLLLLDEPTAVLGEAETERLFAILRRLTGCGAGILYVSHRLDEVLAIADRVTVLRDGQRVSTDAVADVDVPTLVTRMVGRDVPARGPGGRTAGAEVLRLDQISAGHVADASFAVHRGEIVGLAGLVGAGRSEVLEAIAGLRRLRSGRIECAEAAVLLPEDRARNGLVPTLSLRENLLLPADGWRIEAARERHQALDWIRRLAIRAQGTEAPITSLSGGNQQKLLLARALRRAPRLLLLDEPTAGVDVGAKAEIHQRIAALASDGVAVVLASSDLPELLLLCDRIVAMREGRVVGIVAGDDMTEQRLAALITGARDSERGAGDSRPQIGSEERC